MKKKMQLARTIQTTYYFNKMVVKNTASLHANNAVPNCVKHLQTNDYEANVAEVYDSETGELHAVITRRVNGSIVIIFKREVKAIVKGGK